MFSAFLTGLKIDFDRFTHEDKERLLAHFALDRKAYLKISKVFRDTGSSYAAALKRGRRKLILKPGRLTKP